MNDINNKNKDFEELLTKKFNNSLNDEEKQSLEEMISENNSLKRSIFFIERLHIDNSNISNEMRNTWNKIENGISKSNNNIILYNFKRYAIAACISVLCVISGIIGYNFYGNKDSLIVINSGNNVHEFILPDSSKVWLAGGSYLKYPKGLKGKERTIYLNGEAFFNVKKNVERPFYVCTDIAKVRVLGTCFDVKAYKDSSRAEVVLESGSIKLTSIGENKNEVILNPGEMGLVSINEGITVCNVDTDLYSNWKDKYIDIDSKTMENVMFMLSKRYNVKIYIESESLKNEIFSGRFSSDEPLENIFNTINVMVPISFNKQTDGSYIITSENI